MKINEIMEAFLYSLQLNQDAEERVRSDVALQLQSKDKTIADLQNQIDKLQNMLQSSRDEIAKALNSQKAAEDNYNTSLSKIEQLEAMLNDKEQLCSMLSDKLRATEAQLQSYAVNTNLEQELALEKAKNEELKALYNQLINKK